MRCFIAGDIGTEARLLLARLVDGLRPRIPGARWVARESVHLTLEFLGELGEADAARAARALEALANDAPVPAEIRGLGCFPAPGAARVLWTGLRSDGEALEALAGRVRGITAALGLGGRDDKPFVAHLTLARFRPPADLGVVELGGQSRETVVGRCLIDRVILMQSFLSPAGAEYRPILEIALGGAGRHSA